MPGDDIDPSELMQVTTATATHELFKMGVRNTFLEGLRPLIPDAAVAGRARTLRFLPMREDLVPEGAAPRESPQRRAIESIRPGEVLVIDAGGELGAGTLGDMLAARFKYLGGAAIVVDGAVRDADQIREVGLPVWVKGVHGAASARVLWAADMDLPIRCGGCAVVPGDFILADPDGVVVIPARHAAQIAEVGAEIERREAFLRRKISLEGYSTDRAYPPDSATLAEYEEWKKHQA